MKAFMLYCLDPGYHGSGDTNPMPPAIKEKHSESVQARSELRFLWG